MSYILDALRRAESERGRGQVPGLHAQATPLGLGEAGPTRVGRSAWAGLGGAALAVLLVLGLWWWSRPDPPPETRGDRPPLALPAGAPPAGAAPAGENPARPIEAPPPGAAQTLPPPAPPAAASPVGPPLLVAPPAPPAPPAATAPVAPAAVAAPAAARGPAGPAAATARTGTATPAPAGPATESPAVPSNKPILLADLPAAQRAELPQMLIGGAIYSDQASSRFVVINGLVVREGETAAPGVVLERIGPKSALIRWREMKIELPI